MKKIEEQMSCKLSKADALEYIDKEKITFTAIINEAEAVETKLKEENE
ncbi:hypothetical protein SH1V18_27240 [Vallitalea longa]|uniref:Uncharacterized protein n=1 Tax=Vallitalea longa TaxID=2936439 RepID=A0A9W6DGX3_9FIRM|nr:hypothetical protein [Vallitalea longa]GKX30244.1 hypothetical protein SH1V18_27240 [Vallitalea longa]